MKKRKLYLYLLSQKMNTGWDTYDGTVVAAPDEDTARRIHPAGSQETVPEEYCEPWEYLSWCPLEYVRVKLIGLANADVEEGVILSSFNAG